MYIRKLISSRALNFQPEVKNFFFFFLLQLLYLNVVKHKKSRRYAQKDFSRERNHNRRQIARV